VAVVGTIWIGDRDYTLDDLSLGEIEDFEEAMGAPMGDVDLSAAKAIIYLAYLVKRREDPTYTLDDARTIRLVDIIKPDDEGDAPLDVTDGTGATDAAADGTQPTDQTDASAPATSGPPAS
jgi:hypothetical protein